MKAIRRVEWLGEIPSHWEVVRAKRIFREVSEKNHPNAELLSVTQDNGVIPRDQLEQRVVMPLGQLQTFKLVRADDFVISLRSFQGGIEYSSYTGLVSPAYTVLRKQREVHSGYLKYLLKSECFISELNTSVTGIRQGKNIDFAAMSYSHFPIPTKNEQEKIANFLDPKIAEIEAAIAKKQRLIELLQEQKSILINQAVTRGLKSNVPMRDSGVELIGEIPAHWKLKPLKRLVTFTGGGTPNKNKLEYWDGDIPWVSPKDMKFEEICGSQDTITELAMKKSSVKLIPINSILIVVRGMILARTFPVGLNTVPVTINQDMKALTPHSEIDPIYLKYLLSGMTALVLDLTEESGHGTKTLPTDKLASFLLVVPPIDEQVAIRNFCKQITEQVESAIESVQNQLTQLYEFKHILIATAVTGKIKIL